MRTLFVAALMATVASSAMAADLPTHKAPYAPSPAYNQTPAFTWGGLYAGINGGFSYMSLGNTNFGNNGSGLIGGTLGYNMQFGQIVFGAEGDLDYSFLKSNNTFARGSNSYSVNWITTERLRLGYAVDRALFYVTGGYAGMNTHATVSDAFGNGFTQDRWRSGGVIGGGVEYAFTNNITAKAEYLYAPMENETYWSGLPYQETNHLDVSIARVGLNFKF